MVTAFFDAYLKADAAARGKLLSQAHASSLGGPGMPEMRWYTKRRQ